MDRLSDGHDSHWPHGLGDEDDMMDFLTDWVVPHAPAGAVNNLNLQDNSFLDHRPHPQLQYQPSASLPMNIAAPTATNAFSDLASVPQRRPVLDEQATLRQSRLVNWNLDSEGRSLPILDNEDGDAACKSPSSLGSCPSHCGKPGQGSVCCRDDDCAAGTVCSDEECDDAGNLCDDEDCLADISPEAFPGLGEEVGGNFAMLGLGPGAKTQKQADEVAAAAALTSFAENPPFLHQPFRNLRRDSRLPPLDESYFDTFGGSSFHNSPNSSQGRILSNAQTSTFHNAFAPSFHETHGFSSDGRHHGFDPNNNMLMSPHSAGDNIFQQQQQQQQHLPDKSYLAYTSHVLNYHNPVISTADHSGSCFLNNTSLTLPPSCPLPLDQALKANDLHPACGFAIQDPLAFQQHILSEHHDLKSTLPASGPCNLDWTTADPFTPDSQSNFWNFMQDPGLLFTQLHTRQVSSSHSLENASATPSFMPTPTLSSSQDGREGFQVNERRGLGSKQEMSNFDPESPLKSLETARDSAVLLELPADLTEQPKAPCQCMWLDDKTELPCNKWFDCARALDEHCRQDHVKPMERSEGGYRCRWQMCPRRNKDHFPQRGKLNRHLQVHTGCR